MSTREEAVWKATGTLADHLPAGSTDAAAVPIDIIHLERQTMGDRALESEVLVLFLAQLDSAAVEFPALGLPERQRAAHALVGASRGVGAFTLANCASAIEARPADAEAIDRFREALRQVSAFIKARIR